MCFIPHTITLVEKERNCFLIALSTSSRWQIQRESVSFLLLFVFFFLRKERRPPALESKNSGLEFHISCQKLQTRVGFARSRHNPNIKLVLFGTLTKSPHTWKNVRVFCWLFLQQIDRSSSPMSMWFGFDFHRGLMWEFQTRESER